MDATPQPTWPPAAPPPNATPARPASSGRTPTAVTIAAVALAGVLVGFGGAQALDHTPGLARIGSMLNSAPAASAPAASAPAASTTTNPAPAAPANPAPGRTRAPAPANQAPASGSQAPASGNQAPASGNQAPATSRRVAAGQPASSQDQAAIQQAIQSIDDAQTSAVASNDLSGLAAGSTSDFAAQQQNVTQDLLDNGVTEIKLVNIEWGPITVSGTTATATAYETWSTTYSDGATDQSRDRNVYTLVQQNGNWVVQADEHPDAFTTGLQGIPGIPDNLLPPGFPNPFPGRGPQGQPATGNNTPPVQVQP
ncbi:MAG TPA: hypothetical protein VGJ60_01750 [Chloroflexota bacterium]